MTHPLTKYRADQNLSQPELAERLGVGRSTVHRWESGERLIDRKRVASIAELTGIPVKELRPDLAEIFGGSQ